MTDADLASRAAAHAGETLGAWTPEAVQFRMIEAALVFSQIPAKIGPARMATAWPVFVRTAQDLVDDETQTRLMRFPHLVGNWEARIDDKTKRHLSRETQEAWERIQDRPNAEAVSRAEEALLWPARYLVDQPLLADALTLWAFCLGTGASLRASLRARVERADLKMRETGRSSRQAAIPDKNFDRRLVRERRKDAATIICRGVIRDSVVLREAAEAISADSDE